MIQIPDKLKRKDINFVLIEPKGKVPLQKNWQNKEIKYNSQELLDHIANGGNYGVRGGGGYNLIIVDFDSEKLQNALLPHMPPTFVVKTGRGLFHLYYLSTEAKSFKLFSEESDTLADILGEGKQAIGPGSTHPNGTKYEVVKDNPIEFIDYAELKALLLPYNKKPIKNPKPVRSPNTKGEDDRLLGEMKAKISIKMVLDLFGIDTAQNPTMCLFHDSKGGKCLGFNGEVAHCFHCDEAWNIFSLVMVHKHYDFRETLQFLAEKFNMINELQESKDRYFKMQIDDIDNEKLKIKAQYVDALFGDPRKKDWATSSEILVDYIKENNKIYTIKYDAKNEMWIYRDGIYVPNGRSEVSIIIREILGDLFSNYILGIVTLKIEADTYIDAPDFFNFDPGVEVPVENGLLNVLTRELNDFDQEKIFFNKFPVKYDPDAKCPKISDFLKDVLSKEDDISLYYELVGFILLHDYKFEKAFIFVGDGRNGKGKSLELIKRLVGLSNCCSLPLASMNPDNFSISELFGKRVNLAGDIGNSDLKDTSMFKALTGRDLIGAKRKFLNELHFENTAKFVFACNELPRVYDTSKGFWDRWVLLDFPYTFVTAKEHSEAEDITFLRIRDEDIIQKITGSDEMSGLLNEALDALDRLLKQRNFSSTLGAEEIKHKWVMKSDSFMAFCHEHLKEDATDYIMKRDLRKKYSQYCKQNKVKIVNDQEISRGLTELFGAYSEKRNVLAYEQERVWTGVTWKNASI